MPGHVVGGRGVRWRRVLNVQNSLLLHLPNFRNMRLLRFPSVGKARLLQVTGSGKSSCGPASARPRPLKVRGAGCGVLRNRSQRTPHMASDFPRSRSGDFRERGTRSQLPSLVVPCDNSASSTSTDRPRAGFELRCTLSRSPRAKHMLLLDARFSNLESPNDSPSRAAAVPTLWKSPYPQWPSTLLLDRRVPSL